MTGINFAVRGTINVVTEILVIRSIIIVLYFLWPNVLSAKEVIELGEASLFGKKDQPEVALTFISRAALEDNTIVPIWKASPAIIKSVEDRIFKVGME